jgi:hypothetical protein
MEDSRLRSELARVTMERDILHPTDEDLSAGTLAWEKRWCTSRKASDEVHLYSTPQAGLPDLGTVPGATGERLWLPRALGARVHIAQRRYLSDQALLVYISAVYAENRGAYGGS